MTANTTVNTIKNRWTEQDDDQRQLNLNSLNYVQALAASTGTNIKRWNVLVTFGVGDESDNLVTDPRQLNKRFFDKLASVKVQGPAANDEQQAKLITALRKQAARTARTSLRRARNCVSDAQNRANSYYQQYVQQLKMAARAQETVNTLEEDTSGAARADQVAQQLADAVAGGFWCDPLMNSSKLWLRTSGNVMMRESNPAANLDLNIDLGRLGVVIDFNDNSVMVVPDSDNKGARDGYYYHPHVSGGGNICWGDAYEVVNQHLINWEYGAVLDLLAALLTTYCANAPYAPLGSFVDAGEYDRRRLSRELRRPDVGAELEDEQQAPGFVAANLQYDVDTGNPTVVFGNGDVSRIYPR